MAQAFRHLKEAVRYRTLGWESLKNRPDDGNNLLPNSILTDSLTDRLDKGIVKMEN